MIKVALNLDEVSNTVKDSLTFIRNVGLKYVELRSINGVNLISLPDREVLNLKDEIKTYNLDISAIASPLFKWYKNKNDAEVIHDNFGFNPRLGLKEKKQFCLRMLEIAELLNVDKVRIFSNLSNNDNANIDEFINDEVLVYAIEQAEKEKITLLIENENTCVVKHLSEIKKVFSNINNDYFKLWLDVANIYENSEIINREFLNWAKPYVGYVHLKDFNKIGNATNYLPLGQGVVGIQDVVQFFSFCSTDNIFMSIENHTKNNKIESILASLNYLKRNQEKIIL